MKALIMAGGKGSRMSPCTLGLSKHLLPVYDKPMIFYPLSIAMLAGCQEIAIICDPDQLDTYKLTLKFLQKIGVNVKFITQEAANGIPEGITLAEDFLNGDDFLFLLGDNLLIGPNITSILSRVRASNISTVFGYQVKDPRSYGVAKLNATNSLEDIIEKPKNPPSNTAIIGIYYYTQSAITLAKELEPSARGELEISDLNKALLRRNELNIETLGRGFTWLDLGTPERLLTAANLINSLQAAQGYQIACLEEIAIRNKWISASDISASPSIRIDNEYGNYLRTL